MHVLIFLCVCVTLDHRWIIQAMKNELRDSVITEKLKVPSHPLLLPLPLPSHPPPPSPPSPLILFSSPSLPSPLTPLPSHPLLLSLPSPLTPPPPSPPSPLTQLQSTDRRLEHLPPHQVKHLLILALQDADTRSASLEDRASVFIAGDMASVCRIGYQVSTEYTTAAWSSQ